ncbi:MAG: histidinol-phosphatase [Pirellulales bacterium]|nr:histidinol-phosphatase [Pirellulales bacterium]
MNQTPVESEILRPRWELAVEIAREAGALAMGYFNRPELVVQRKGDDSPVTVADREAEQLLRRRIAEAFPEDAIHGEEFPDKKGQSPFRWILDPIDGTKSFIHGVPLFATLVAIEHAGTSVVGVIQLPALGETLHAAAGQGAWHVVGDAPPRPARVSECPRLAEGLFVTSEVASFDRRGLRPVYDRLQNAARLSRTWGDAFGYFLVATGRAELMVDPVMELWDAAPMLPILEEAGGAFTDWQGTPTTYSRRGMATNGRVQQEALALIRG